MDPSDRDRKKAWKDQQKQAAQLAFPASNDVLQSLFESVEAEVETQGCDHSLRFTREWITSNNQPKDKLLAWLAEHGGYCDCEVVANSFDHWQQNR
ncbi:MAG TPA: DUF2695 domain-containing protein [Vicinamibacterales bacterium]|nr:DUF2695 domain-containing protein [Vicinamibacterales bacterium]